MLRETSGAMADMSGKEPASKFRPCAPGQAQRRQHLQDRVRLTGQPNCETSGRCQAQAIGRSCNSDQGAGPDRLADPHHARVGLLTRSRL